MDVATIVQELSSHKILAGFVGIICYFIAGAIYNVYFHPLAKYPGPLLAKITGLPTFYHALTGNRHIWIWQCHQIYGDAFRFHPNGVLFNSPTAYPSIYGNRANIKKAKFYEAWSRNSQNINTITTVDRKAHGQKRRVLNQVFSEKAVSSAEAFIVKHVDAWCDVLIDGTGKDWTESKNISDYNDWLVFDIMGDLAFGIEFNSKEPADTFYKKMPHVVTDYVKFMYPITKSPFLNAWVWLKPRGLDNILAAISPQQIKDYYKFLEVCIEERIEQEKEIEKQESQDGHQRKDMFHYLCQAKDPETGKQAFSRDELEAEASLLVVAGTDTTATVMSGFYFYITRNPRVYAKVIAEIRNTFSTVQEIRGGPKLTSCQYLRACIDETTRMAPPGPSEMPREVDKGGQVIDGMLLPQGTIVGTGSWARMHHDECYGDPFIFRPERWIVDPANNVTKEDVAKAQTAFTPFLIGPGNCAGQKLAVLEMMIAFARTLYRFEVRATPGSTLGEGAPELGWGKRNRNEFQIEDRYIALRYGPMVQFKRREV